MSSHRHYLQTLTSLRFPIGQKQNFDHLIVVFVLSLLFSIQAFSSVAPGMAGSIISQFKSGIFMTPQGFQVVLPENASWEIQPIVDKKFSWLKKNTQATASLVSEDIKSDLAIEQFARRWTKNFMSYGFEILGMQDVKINQQPSVIIDLLHRKEPKQVRQILFLKEKKLVVITCSDEKAQFQNSLNDCNLLAQGFYWN